MKFQILLVTACLTFAIGAHTQQLACDVLELDKDYVIKYASTEWDKLLGQPQCPEIKPTILGVIQNDITNHEELTERWSVAYNAMGIGNVTAEDFNVITSPEICAFFNDEYREVMEETVLLPGFDDKTYDVGFFIITIGENPVYITIQTPARVEGWLNHGYTSVSFYNYYLELQFAYSY